VRNPAAANDEQLCPLEPAGLPSTNGQGQGVKQAGILRGANLNFDGGVHHLLVH